MNRVVAIVIIIIILLSVTACGANSTDKESMPCVSNNTQVTYGADLLGNEGGQLFDPVAISLPDIGVRIENAAYIDSERIILLGVDDKNTQLLYCMDVSNFSVNRTDIALYECAVDICTDLGGTLYTLSVNQNGDYIITSRCLTETAADITCIPVQSPTEDEPLWKMIKMSHGFLIAGTQYVYAFSDTGSYVKKFGPYVGVLSLVSDGVSTLICSSAETKGATIYVVDDEFSISSTYNIKNSCSDFYDGRNDVIFARLGNVIYALNYKENSKVGYANIFASGCSANNYTYVNESNFISIEDGVPTLWSLNKNKETTKTLKLATYKPDTYLMWAVSAFNSSSPNIKIDIVDYSIYDERNSDATGLTRMKSDIISGNVPDIYDLSCLPINVLAEKGLLEDIKPYFFQEQEVTYSDLVESIAAAMEKDGHIYSMIPTFYIVSLCGSTVTVGSDSSWSLEDYFDLAQNYASTELLGPEITKEAFLQLVLAFDANSFFCYDTATCNFDDSLFIEILNYAKHLPDKYIDDGYQNRGRTYCGKQKLLFGTWGDNLVLDILINNAVFSDRINYIGFPSYSNTGVAALPVMQFGMSSLSDQKDAIWEFFQFLLSENYQSKFIQSNEKIYDGRWCIPGIPSVKANLEKRLDYWLSMYSSKPAQLGTFVGDTPMIIEGRMATSATKEQALALVSKVSSIYEIDNEIYSIVMDAAAPFFEGDKSVNDVSYYIQSRVNLYLAEQYG